MASPSQINTVQYSALDVSTHYDNVISRIQAKWGDRFNDFVVGSMGVVLIDIVANALGSLSFYLDRRATDLYLETARTPKSVTSLTRQLGYKMASASSSSTDLQVTLTAQYDFDVTIPRGFQFRGPSGLVFQAAQDVLIPKKSTATFDIPVYEGETVSDSFVSDGTVNQAFRLRAIPAGKNIVAGSLSTKVDGVPFAEVAFLEPSSGDSVEVSYSDNPPLVRFGDGVLGNVPVTGGSIVVTYVAASGLLGQAAANSITAPASDLVVNLTRIPMVVTNGFAASGGADPETFGTARSQARTVYKSRNVAITQADYEALSGSFADPVFGKVAVAQAVSTRSSSGDIEVQNQMGIITNAVAFRPAEQVAYTDATAQLAAMDAELNASTGVMIGMLNTIADLANKIANTDLASAQDVTRNTQKTNLAIAPLLTGNGSGIVDIANSGIAAVNLIALDTPSQLTQSDKDALNAYFNRISSQSALILSTANSMTAALTTVINQFSAAIAKAEQIGVDLSAPAAGSTASKLYLADSSRTRCAGYASAVSADLATIDSLVLDVTTTVANALTAIDAHINKILSVDSKANLITVPVLTKDSSGFYAQPSSGLLRTLQDYLDARKEVTHTVEVVSGSGSLVGAAITANLGVRTGYSESVIAKTVDTQIDGLLRNRKFGKSLFVSDLVSAVQGNVGLSYVNITIDGNLQDYADPASTVVSSRLDVSGNLIVKTSEVVTKGKTIVTTEPAAS